MSFAPSASGGTTQARSGLREHAAVS